MGIALLIGAAAAAAPAPPARASVAAIESAVDSLYFSARPGDALSVCRRQFIVGNETASLRWRAARSAIALGMNGDGPERTALYEEALAEARRAIALDSTSVDSRYWLAAAAGRRANARDPIYSARLAGEVHRQVMAILAADSLHAGAHHALGMLHAEVSRLPRAVRLMAGRVMKNDVARSASLDEAERHLRRAVALDSSMILYRSDLAELYRRRGQTDSARVTIDRLVTLAPRHPMDVTLLRRVSRPAGP